MSAEDPSPPALGHIDLPAGRLTGAGSFTVAGWAVGDGPLAEVRVSLDGVLVGQAEIGIARPDVAGHFTAYPHAGRSGFLLHQVPAPPAGAEVALLSLEIRFGGGEVLRLEQPVAVLRRATELLAELRAAPPLGPEPLLEAAGQFMAAAAWDEAEALLGVAVARFPGDPRPLAEYARLAARLVVLGLGPAEEASRRLAELHHRFPAAPSGGLEEARALAVQHRYEEAELLLGHAVAAGDARPELLRARANVATARAHRADAARYLDAWREVREAWDALLRSRPEDVEALIGAGHARLQCDRIAEAERFLAEAAGRYPGEPMLALWHAHAAGLRDDPAEAVRRWEALRVRFPGFTAGADLEGQARVALAAAEASPGPPLPATLRDDRDLLLHFEALGSNCEFGNVQRAFGAEPLGLFRFSSGNAAELVAALDRDLEGIGAPEHTTLDIVAQPRPEYYTGDRRWHFRAHTFIYPDQVPDATTHAALLAKHCTRLQFLRRKLLEDLAAAEKIVVHGEYLPTTPERRRRLLQALRRHGPNQLLFVIPAEPGQPSGSLELEAEGLLVGRIDGFVGVTRPTLNLPDWLKLCRAAYAMWRGG